jgi:hypothetical protein
MEFAIQTKWKEEKAKCLKLAVNVNATCMLQFNIYFQFYMLEDGRVHYVVVFKLSCLIYFEILLTGT